MSKFNDFQDFLAEHENSCLFQIGFGFIVGGIFRVILLILKLTL